MQKKDKEKFVVLGIDASLTGTGLCILTNDFLKGEKPKTTTLVNDLKGISRILYIEKEVEKWAKNVDLIVIENYAYTKKYNRETLAELQGVLKRRLFLMNKELLVVNTQKVKKILTGNGKKPKKYEKLDTKKWTILETKKNYQIDFTNRDNECDAFGLALIGLFYLMYQNDPELIKKYKRECSVVEEILKSKNKKKKRKTIHYYYKLPYKIQVIKNNDDTYSAYCPGLDFTWKGKTPKEALKNALKGKKDRIKDLKKNKKKIKTAKKYMGGISFIIKKQKNNQ